jgi:hypothetical protein
LESVEGKPDLGLVDKLDFVLCDVICDGLVVIDLAVGNVLPMFLDDELRELSDKHRQLERFTVVVSKTEVICCAAIRFQLPTRWFPRWLMEQKMLRDDSQ